MRVGNIVPDAASQTDLLAAAGCTTIFTDDPPPRFDQRRELRAMLDGLRRGDVVTVCGLAVIGRDVDFMIETVLEIGSKGARFRALSEDIDTGVARKRSDFPGTLRLIQAFQRELVDEASRGKLPRSRALKRPPGRPLRAHQPG